MWGTEFITAYIVLFNSLSASQPFWVLLIFARGKHKLIKSVCWTAFSPLFRSRFLHECSFYILLFTCYCRLINKPKVFSCTAVNRNCSCQPWSWLIIKHSSLNFGGKKCVSSLCFQVLSVITSPLLQVEELCLKLMSPVRNRRLRHLSHRSCLFMTERSLIIVLCAGSLIAVNLLSTKAFYGETSLGFMSGDSHHFSFCAL